jgi:hypothetical protein
LINFWRSAGLIAAWRARPPILAISRWSMRTMYHGAT